MTDFESGINRYNSAQLTYKETPINGGNGYINPLTGSIFHGKWYLIGGSRQIEYEVGSETRLKIKGWTIKERGLEASFQTVSILLSNGTEKILRDGNGRGDVTINPAGGFFFKTGSDIRENGWWVSDITYFRTDGSTAWTYIHKKSHHAANTLVIGGSDITYLIDLNGHDLADPNLIRVTVLGSDGQKTGAYYINNDYWRGSGEKMEYITYTSNLYSGKRDE